MALTAKQSRFVTEYLKSLNGTQAAIAAGYSPRTARSIASETLRKPAVIVEIERQQDLTKERLDAERDYLLRKLVKIADFDISRLYKDNDTMLPIAQWPPEAADIVAFYKYSPIPGKPGWSRSQVKFHDRLKVLKTIGDMVGAFAPARKNAKRRS